MGFYRDLSADLGFVFYTGFKIDIPAPCDISFIHGTSTATKNFNGFCGSGL